MNPRTLTPSCDSARSAVRLRHDERQLLDALSQRAPELDVPALDSSPLTLDAPTGAWLRLGRYERRRQRLLAARAYGRHILDVGYAAMPNPYLPHPRRHITGIDVSEPPAADGYNHRLVGDIFKLRQLSGQQRYDTIIAGEFIEHLENPYALVRELAGSLNPGGRLILSTPNPVCLPVVLCEWLRSRRFFFDNEHTYYFSPRWMIRLLERAGYTLVDVRGVGLWPFGLPCPVGVSYQVIYEAALW